MKHSQRLWAILIEDEDGKRFLPILNGIVTTKTRAECEKVLKQWTDVRCQYKPIAKVVPGG